jgi:hypothetical protein
MRRRLVATLEGIQPTTNRDAMQVSELYKYPNLRVADCRAKSR